MRLKNLELTNVSSQSKKYDTKIKAQALNPYSYILLQPIYLKTHKAIYGFQWLIHCSSLSHLLTRCDNNSHIKDEDIEATKMGSKYLW